MMRCLLTAVKIADTAATHVKSLECHLGPTNFKRYLTIFCLLGYTVLLQYLCLFLQLYEVFCKYAKEHPNLGMTPTEFAEFLYREQEASHM